MATKFEKLLNEIPAETSLMVSKSFDVTERILNILDEKGMTQKDFARLMGKKESEICKWMKGTHNFTLETISKIELVLGETILQVPKAVYPVESGATSIKEVYFDAKIQGGTPISPKELASHKNIIINRFSFSLEI